MRAAAEKAGRALRRDFGEIEKLQVSQKGPGDFVTNADLKAEIDAVQSHCNVLQGQNKDLNIELERFVSTDEQIRATLNRRDRVMDLQAKNQHEFVKS